MDSWTFDDQSWQRSTDNHFEVVTFRGLEAIGHAHDTQDLAALVGAHECPEDGQDVLYPGLFRHSPLTGKPLPAIASPAKQTWLPPFGNSHSINCLGLRQSALSLHLHDAVRPDTPDRRLPLPPPGEYRFIVGNLKAFQPQLLAVNPKKGRLYLYLHRGWVELEKQGKRLPESSLNRLQWSVCLDGAEENRLYFPTDDGLAILDINVFKLGYELQLITARCIGSPALLEGWIMLPALDKAGKAGILKVSRKNLSEDWLPFDAAETGGAFNIPLAERDQTLWLNGQGQLKIKLNLDSQPTPSHLPWNQCGTPRFEFGSVYSYVRYGTFWQLCYDSAGGYYQYVKLDQENPEKYVCRSPRFTSGTISFPQASQFKDPPWSDGDVAADATSNAVSIPLLETANDAVLCARIEWVKGLEELLDSPRPQLTHYDLIGRNGDRCFFTHKLPSPWLALPFVHRDYLYLYHPEIDHIPGWKLA